MKEGGFVHIYDGRIKSWNDNPGDGPIYDKYGERYNSSDPYPDPIKEVVKETIDNMIKEDIDK